MTQTLRAMDLMFTASKCCIGKGRSIPSIAGSMTAAPTAGAVDMTLCRFKSAVSSGRTCSIRTTILSDGWLASAVCQKKLSAEVSHKARGFVPLQLQKSDCSGSASACLESMHSKSSQHIPDWEHGENQASQRWTQAWIAPM